MTEVAKQAYGTGSSPVSGMKELFVINLCASMTPMPDVPRQLQGFEKYRLYQISKMEDGRRRYRLRMGFFTNETDAEFLVATIRSMYPAALVGCALTEDLRIAEFDPANRLNDAADNKPALAVVPPPAAPNRAQPVSKSEPAIAPAKPAVAAKATPAPAETASLTLAEPPAAPAAVTASPDTSDTRIFHVGRGVTIPDSALQLSAEEPAPAVKPAAAPVTASKPAPAADKPAATKPTSAPIAATSKPVTAAATPSNAPTVAAATSQSAKPAAKPTANAVASAPAVTPAASKPAAVAPKPAPAVQAPPAQLSQRPAQAATQPIVATTIQAPTGKPTDDYIPILDTTLTIRTLTKAEAEDPNRPKWFVVQLASSDRPIDVSTMPKLDIFAAYSLYSVALMESGGIRHTLRLGFFKEQVSADAVMGYLKTFFNSPCVTQISAGEYDRFTTDKPKKPAAPQTAANAPAQPARASTASTTTVKATPVSAPVKTVSATTVRVPPAIQGDANKSQSFLSRLIGKQLD